MTAGQTVNLCGSIVALSGSLAFVLVYSAFAPWWRNQVGRLLVSKALVIAGFMVVSLTAYALDPGNGRHIGVLLLVRGMLAAGFGLAMYYQSWLVGYTHIRMTARHRAAGGEVTGHVHGSQDEGTD